MAQNELVHVCGNETSKGFKVLPLQVRHRKVKAVKVEKSKGKVGRPRVYNGTHRRIVAAALKNHGLTKGLAFLAKERKLKVSMTLAISVAKENGIEFKRGRPAA